MKNILREEMLQRRNSMCWEDIIEKSGIIKKKLFSLPEFKKAKVVMFFVSFNSEVHTHNMIKELLKSRRVAVPMVVGNEIHPSLIIDFDQLIPRGKFDILEPIELLEIGHKNIDIVLAAGIAFDRKGHRIGYGYGYYDKFLRKVPKALKIGLAFDFQIVDKIQNAEHDVPVDMIVTEKEIVRCER